MKIDLHKNNKFGFVRSQKQCSFFIKLESELLRLRTSDFKISEVDSLLDEQNRVFIMKIDLHKIHKFGF